MSKLSPRAPGSTTRPAHLNHDDQYQLDRLIASRGIAGAAVALGVVPVTCTKLQYGGHGKAETIAKVAVALAVLR